MEKMIAKPSTELWYSPGACSLAPHILLRDAGLPFIAKPVGLSEGEHLVADNAQPSPKRCVPVLVVDGWVVTEVQAIMAAIAELARDKRLLGVNDVERVRSLERLIWLSGTLHAEGFGALWRLERFFGSPAHHDAIRAKGRASIAKAFDFIEGRLGGVHAVGAVDASLLVFHRWSNGVGFHMASAHPRYAALARNAVFRPAVREALAAEGIDESPLRDRIPSHAIA